MRKIFGLLLGAYSWINILSACAVERFEVLPDLPEPLAAAQASSVSTTSSNVINDTVTQSVGQEPNILSVVLSLVFVILLIYATGIIYTKLNRVGAKTLKKQLQEKNESRVSVISTTPLGSNKTLHVVELDGKRMLIGASANSIDLIKDLGSYPPVDIEEGEFSKIEIPNIRIPKIEIPRIEFPNLGFSKAKNYTKTEPEIKTEKQEKKMSEFNEDENGFVISDIYEESSDGIIDKLFTPQHQEDNAENIDEQKLTVKDNHSIDPEDYALYKKYL